MDDTLSNHEVLKLWNRPDEGGPMVEQDALELRVEGGCVGDHTFGRLRHLTLVFEADWQRAADDLGRTVDPVGRRANVLLSGGDGGRLIGRQIRIGPVLLEVKGETAPCPVMEKAAPGMMAALKPETRAGVWCRVVEGGTIRRGQPLNVQS